MAVQARKPQRRKAAQSKKPGIIPICRAAPEKENIDTIKVRNRIFPGRPMPFAGHTLDILPDAPDIRDRIYQPHLRALHPSIFPRIAFDILNQGAEASCTGFSLAHVIDFLRYREIGPDKPTRVSPRMLYEMARRNDEWEGTAYEGSSIRGALKGFFQNGVCRQSTDMSGAKEWMLTYEMAKEAKEIRLGAYYRLQPDVSDYHAALNEIGAIYVSAQVHSNWDNPKNGRIEPGGKLEGGHAFAIVGYDETGFWILNSWGEEWGDKGIAHWSYRDWAETVMDAWVLQLGVRAPEVFGITAKATPAGTTGFLGFGDPNRSDILGHFINIDDGRFEQSGKYGSPTTLEMKETVTRLTNANANGGSGYDHLVIYAHGGLNSLADDARRIATWKRNDIFGRNRLYNFHLMWGSGLIDEAFGDLSQTPAGRAAGAVSDWFFEVTLKERGSYAWRNMKQDAKVAFGGEADFDGGFVGLGPLLGGIDAAARRPKLHLVGHSAGAIVIGQLLNALHRFKLSKLELGSIHLMAPACTVDFFKANYGPYLSGTGALQLRDKIYLYNLTDELELDDEVRASFPFSPAYGRSLLYLVSRAYEEMPKIPLAGMQTFVSEMPKGAKLDIAYAQSGSKVTASEHHGDFDNDVATIATIMSRILGGKLPSPPNKGELTGY